ncbi:hypothetical protein F3Y22_tig00002840pilonHSYRG01117 [Hibiscus syriacus]|uniref:Secretory carrier-associated membrane protein n=1 Tax=Hibiscus syriacus TaxID=106335 RepID=A0A6A3CPE5_HIBSY|nr:hypothetical protein F3Y22_tig00002840pilonHSYRG01117 [Hibiscus syriacus]
MMNAGLMDWRKLFGSAAEQTLEYFPPVIREGFPIPSVQPPLEVFEAGIFEWKLSLVGKFLGSAPPFASMQRIVNNLWTTALMGSGVQLYSRVGLSYIASALGVPLSIDSMTASKSRLEYAKTRESKFKGFHMYSSFSIPIFGVLLISILSENIESKATARSSSKVVECRVDSISCAGRAGDGNIDFSYCNKDLDCNNSSHSSVSVCSLGSEKVPSSQKLDLSVHSMKDGGSGGSSTMIQIPSSHFGSSKSAVGGRFEISPKIHPKLEEDIEGSSENPLDKTGCLAPKRQVVDGSPRSLSPNGVSSLSREISFKNLDKGKVRPSPQIYLGNHSGNDMQEVVRSLTSGPRLQTPKGSLLKCSSFNTLNSNSKVKLVMRVLQVFHLPQTQDFHRYLWAGFSYDRGATIDIPLDTASGGSHNQDLNKKVQAKEAELKRREHACSGIVVEEKNWPPFFPIIHHDIASEIPIHLQRLQIVSMPSVEHHSRYYSMDQRGREMKLYTAQSGSNKRCPRQSRGTECGYYVCKFMKEIVENGLEVLVNKNEPDHPAGEGLENWVSSQVEELVEDLVVESKAISEAPVGMVVIEESAIFLVVVDFPVLQASSQKKKAKGRGNDKKLLAGSSNHFEVLVTSVGIKGARKPRVISMGVTALLNEMKNKKKDFMDKGFNNQLKQVQVFSRLGKLNIDVIFLMETRVRTVNMVLKVFDQSLSIVGEISGHRSAITAVYGSNNGADRQHLWRQLEEVESMVGVSYWLIGGDFNIIANAEESFDFESLGPYDTADMEALRNCLSSLVLIDHPFVGPLFICFNRQEGNYLAHKLDRVLINSRWLEDFPNSFVEFKTQGVSDHCLALISFFKENHVDRPKPFKFFNCWASHGDFKNIVKESWQLEVSGTAMYCLFTKLKRIKLRLKEFNRCHFEDISRSLFYKQKAKVHWLKEGYRNTKFFHSVVLRKRKKNTIRLLYAEDDSRLDTFETIFAEMVRFYTELLGIEDVEVKSCDVDLLKGLLVYEIPGNEKSPGPDEYTAYLFKVAWDIVQVDFLAAIREFFQIGSLLPTFNATTIVLVPKSPNACMAKDFHPISCCSVVYKTITGILVNRLVSYFPDMILPNQSAFIKGRSIVDNTLLAQEIVRGYSNSSLSPRGWIIACVTGARFSVAFNLNAGKSKLHTCGVQEDVLNIVQATTGFKFSVRYLGVPLVTRKLTVKDCIPLIDKIRSKLSVWSKLKLSYGGRL